MNTSHTQSIETLIIGAGQAGLSVGHFLAKNNRPFLILDANQRVGDAWRNRWDSLRLFTPARFDGLAGMPFPGDGNFFPTKDQMAEYLESYAKRFALPVQNGIRVERLTRTGRRYVVTAGDRCFEAKQVVVAMAGYQQPRFPDFHSDLRSDIRQMHSSAYRNPAQLQPGPVLLVGAGNSGSEIAMEVGRGHKTWMAGRNTGAVPFRIDGPGCPPVSPAPYFPHCFSSPPYSEYANGPQGAAQVPVARWSTDPREGGRSCGRRC